MTYKRLSEQVNELTNSQRSDTFVRNFREAVRQGKFKAIYLPGERFTLPKQYIRRGKAGSYQKDAKEMLFEHTAKFEEWFKEQNQELAVSRRGGVIKATQETVEAGLIDFEKLASETKQKMQKSFEKGQALGTGRARKVKTSSRT